MNLGMLLIAWLFSPVVLSPLIALITVRKLDYDTAQDIAILWQSLTLIGYVWWWGAITSDGLDGIDFGRLVSPGVCLVANAIGTRIVIRFFPKKSDGEERPDSKPIWTPKWWDR